MARKTLEYNSHTAWASSLFRKEFWKWNRHEEPPSRSRMQTMTDEVIVLCLRNVQRMNNFHWFSGHNNDVHLSVGRWWMLLSTSTQQHIFGHENYTQWILPLCQLNFYIHINTIYIYIYVCVCLCISINVLFAILCKSHKRINGKSEGRPLSRLRHCLTKSASLSHAKWYSSYS